jgi:hypothetical protein
MMFQKAITSKTKNTGQFFLLGVVVNRSDHSVSHKRFTLSIPGAQKFPAQKSPNFPTLALDLN